MNPNDQLETVLLIALSLYPQCWITFAFHKFTRWLLLSLCLGNCIAVLPLNPYLYDLIEIVRKTAGCFCVNGFMLLFLFVQIVCTGNKLSVCMYVVIQIVWATSHFDFVGNVLAGQLPSMLQKDQNLTTLCMMDLSAASVTTTTSNEKAE